MLSNKMYNVYERCLIEADKSRLRYRHGCIATYGGKIIAKRVPGSGKAYQFEDRPALIKALDAKLSTELVEEALLGFELSMGIFDELQEKINEWNNYV